MKTSVAIIGGGIAGLYAARLLDAAGIDFRLLEARDRLGGRVLSVDASGQSAADGFDLGPSWYWPMMQPGMAAVVESLGLEIFPQCTNGDVIFERMSREPPHRYSQVDNQGGSMRIKGGTAALVRALIAGVPDEKIILEAQVRRISTAGSAVTVTYDTKTGTEQTLAAEQVIAALPPRLLASTVVFEPALDQKTRQRWRDTPTWMAPHAKFFAIYDRPFWRDAGLCGTAQSMVGPLAEIHDATTASGSAALFGFIGVGAQQRADLGEPAITKAALAQLVRLFGPHAGSPRATMIKDWAADRLTATQDDMAGGGHPVSDGEAWVAGPWAKRLSLGSSETADREPGYLAGAIQAARRAVDEIQLRLSRSP